MLQFTAFIGLQYFPDNKNLIQIMNRYLRSVVSLAVVILSSKELTLPFRDMTAVAEKLLIVMVLGYWCVDFKVSRNVKCVFFMSAVAVSEMTLTTNAKGSWMNLS